VVGVFGATREDWDIAVAEFVAGNLDPGVLITHEFRLNDIESALNVVESAEPMVGKVLIRP
jgi:threonine dehydrogenase-like Zn-dependent dehydrogenase